VQVVLRKYGRIYGVFRVQTHPNEDVPVVKA